MVAAKKYNRFKTIERDEKTEREKGRNMHIYK